MRRTSTILAHAGALALVLSLGGCGAHGADHSFVERYVDEARPYLERYGAGAVFVAVAVEGFGVPAPGETLVIASGLLAARGELSLWVLLLAWLAAIVGDNVGFAIGRYGGRPFVLRFGRRIGVTDARLEKVERFFVRYGAGVVTIARFLDVLRQLDGIVAGISGMPWWRFFAYDALGTALWVGVWGGGAYLLGEHLAVARALFHRYQPYLIAAALLVAALLIIHLVRRTRRHAD